jgi:dihydroorotate dehydrogenase electron transfer subunit
MPYFQNQYKIVKITNANSSCFDMFIDCPEIAEVSKAGQFLHILCSGKLLRRPISICEIDKAKGSVRIIFDIRGEGTLWLSKRKPGEMLDILGPLGNGFDLTDTSKNVLFVGGGMGIPPLLEGAKAYQGTADAILGYKCECNSILIQDFEKYCSNVYVSTDDGSLGQKGFVTAVLQSIITKKKYDLIFSCGPNVMLKAVSAIAELNKIPCFISMEERMGCGVGACLVCACKTITNGKETYQHVCKDGPVFNAKEVVW